MIQIILLILIVALVLYGLSGIIKALRQDYQGTFRKILLWMVLIVFFGLAATGRLGWIIPVFGAIVATLIRLLPLLIRLFPVFAKYRENAKSSERQQSRQNASNAMSRDEAYDILGLQPGASKEQILEAHKRLIQKVHPDRGGSTYLAAQLNHARDILLD